MEFEVESLSWNCKYKFEVAVCILGLQRMFEVTFELEIWGWSLKLRFEVEVWSWGLKLKFEVKVWSLPS